MTSDFAITADDRGGFVVHLDGQPQSHVNTDDPEDLAFEYVAITAAAVDAVCQARPRPRTHVGGAVDPAVGAAPVAGSPDRPRAGRRAHRGVRQSIPLPAGTGSGSPGR